MNVPPQDAVRPSPGAGRQKVVLSWSGGKDSALALDRLLQDPRYEVDSLLTSIAEEHRRVSHHGFREELLEDQAEALGLPLRRLYLPSGPDEPCTHDHYRALVGDVMRRCRDDGVDAVAHGDIFLADLRAWREGNLREVGLDALFPLWGEDTTSLVRRFVDRGFRAVLTCVEPVLGRTFAGRAIDAGFLDALPDGVDPCGEHGEYHSFVHDGPIFHRPVGMTLGQTVERDGRFYADLLPAPALPIKP